MLLEYLPALRIRVGLGHPLSKLRRGILSIEGYDSLVEGFEGGRKMKNMREGEKEREKTQ